MTRSTDEYLDLVIPEHSTKPKFMATVGLSVDPYARLQVALLALQNDFDLDQAVGPQLDAVGVRVGRSRIVTHPLTGLFFSWDDPIRGWDQGVWQGPFDTGLGIYQLDDDTYRRLLRAKILANTWDGTISGEEAIFNAYFTDPATLVFVSDDSYSAQPPNYFAFDDPARGWDVGEWAPDLTKYLAWDVLLRGWDQGEWPPAMIRLGQPSITSVDMIMTVGFAGKIPSILDLAILDEGLVGAKPEGVTVNYTITSVNDTPLFGFDMENDYVSGWDDGSWGVPPAFLIGQSNQLAVPGQLDFSFTQNSGLNAAI